jgi:hypothetical protein
MTKEALTSSEFDKRIPAGLAKVGNHLWILTWPTWGGFAALLPIDTTGATLWLP